MKRYSNIFWSVFFPNKFEWTNKSIKNCNACFFPRSSNTWEPLENLDNCEKMLADFEKRFAEQGKIPRKKAWRRRRKRKAIGAVVRRNDDDEFEEVKSNLKVIKFTD